MSKRGSTEGSGESLERKAGRLLFVGLPATKLDRHWREFLREVRPGGVILFGRNVESAEQVSMLSAKAVRNAGRADLAEKYGQLTARALRLMGFNINFAPVLDLSGDNDDNGLRARTFGLNPETVSMLAGAYLEGLQRGQIIGCGKHFPGLGGSRVDSHRNLPVVTHTWQEIFQKDLVPFMDLMFHRPGERLRSVMVSHAAFPDISEFLQDLFRQEGDPPTIQGLHQFPATISGNVTTRLLRSILKFDGLVITDDMEMGAVVQTLTVPEACLRAIEAGSDMVLICEREENVVAARDELV